AKIVVAGMMVPPNLGPEYSKEFQAIFPQIAKKNNATLIPFLLADVAGDKNLNQADGIHPNVEGHKIVAKTVLNFMNPIF
ncbi:MAG: SGNH/GDSL hydrolase family protein, partial [Bacteroidota bacterium]